MARGYQGKLIDSFSISGPLGCYEARREVAQLEQQSRSYLEEMATFSGFSPGLGLGMDWDAENGRFKRSKTSSGFSAHFLGALWIGGVSFWPFLTFHTDLGWVEITNQQWNSRLLTLSTRVQGCFFIESHRTPILSKETSENVRRRYSILWVTHIAMEITFRIIYR